MSRYRSSALAASFMDVSGTHWRGVGDTSAGASDMRAVARHLSQRTGGPFVSAAFVVDPTAGSLAGQGNGQGAASGSKAAEADAACRRAAAGAPLAAFAGLTPGAKAEQDEARPAAPAAGGLYSYEVTDEYDPRRPHDYDRLVVLRRKQKEIDAKMRTMKHIGEAALLHLRCTVPSFPQCFWYFLLTEQSLLGGSGA